jgi:hypothetical protein
MTRTVRERAVPSATDPAPAPRRRALPAAALGAVALALLLVAGPAGAATSGPSASTGVWAWGAYDNASATNLYVGDYAASLGLVGGNLSYPSSYVVEYAAHEAVYAAYTVVNVTAPSTTSRSVVASAIALANVTDLVVVNGTLPAAGQYTAGATVPLANDTSIYYAHALSIWAYRLAANYSFVNGALALENEQVELYAGVNASAIAWHWPHYAAGPDGSVVVSYPTAGWAEYAWSAEAANLSFAPAVPLAELPLYVGEQWNATSTASVQGWSAYAVAGAVSSNGTNTTSWTSGGATLNTTLALSFDFSVVGSTSVQYSDGAQETAYAVSSTVNGASGGYAVWDGLAVLPAGGPVPVAPARPAGPVAAPAVSPGPTTVAVVASSGLPVEADVALSGGAALRAAPLPAGAATSIIAATPPPARPSVAPSVPSSSNPPGSGPGAPVQGNSPNPRTQLPSPGGPAGRSVPAVATWQLALIVGTLLAALIAVDRLRARRRPA